MTDDPQSPLNPNPSTGPEDEQGQQQRPVEPVPLQPFPRQTVIYEEERAMKKPGLVSRLLKSLKIGRKPSAGPVTAGQPANSTPEIEAGVNSSPETSEADLLERLGSMGPAPETAPAVGEEQGDKLQPDQTITPSSIQGGQDFGLAGTLPSPGESTGAFESPAPTEPGEVKPFTEPLDESYWRRTDPDYMKKHIKRLLGSQPEPSQEPKTIYDLWDEGRINQLKQLLYGPSADESKEPPPPREYPEGPETPAGEPSPGQEPPLDTIAPPSERTSPVENQPWQYAEPASKIPEGVSPFISGEGQPVDDLEELRRSVPALFEQPGSQVAAKPEKPVQNEALGNFVQDLRTSATRPQDESFTPPAPIDAEAEAENEPFLRRLLSRLAALTNFQKALIILGFLAVIGLAAIILTFSRQTPPPAVVVVIPTITPTPSDRPYPLSIIFPGGWEFSLQRGSADATTWKPNTGIWIEGTELRRVVAVPWNKQTQAVVNSLETGDIFKLLFSNYQEISYRVTETRRVAVDDNSILTDRVPSLAVILYQENSTDRWVVIAKP